MKRKKTIILATFLLLFCLGNANAQINGLHTFEGTIFHSFNTISQLDFSGYWKVDGTNQIRIYNEDFSLRRTVNIQVPQGYNIWVVNSLSQKIFSTDNRLEFIVVFMANTAQNSNSNQRTIMKLYNEDGNLIRDFGTAFLFFPSVHITSNGDYRLLVQRQEIDRIFTDIYSLPGRGNSATSLLETSNVRSDNHQGIRLTSNIVSEIAEICVILPNNERAVNTNIRILDMAGNVVFEQRSTTTNSAIWNLTNNQGRFVANGTYLVVAEARDRNGRVFQYSTRLGVNR